MCASNWPAMATLSRVLRIAMIRAQSPGNWGGIRRWSVSRMNKKALSKFGAAFLVIGLIVAGYIVIDQLGRDRARAAAARPAPAIPVTVATAATNDLPIIVRGIVTVQAYKSVIIK